MEETSSRKVKISLIQMSMVDSKEENLKKAIQKIREAALSGAKIVSLSELFLTPYFCNKEHVDKDYTDLITNVYLDSISKLAKELEIVIVAGSIYEKTSDDRKFNTAVVFDTNGESLGLYRKMHIPHDPSFFELNYFEPGDLGYKVFDTQYGKIGILICYDQWFPEAARSLALQGVDIIFYPTAIGTFEGANCFEGDWEKAWRTVQVGHAIANNITVATINRVGKEGISNFFGGSFISDGWGNILAQGDDKESIITAEVDLSKNDRIRREWRFRESRRPDTYLKITDQ